MNRALRLLFLLSCVSVTASRVAAAQTPPASPEQDVAPESREVQDASARALRAQVLELFRSDQYGPLDGLAQQLRSQHTRFRGGAWQLNALYSVIDSPGSTTATDAEWDALVKKLQFWAAAEPASPTPRIALGRAYLSFAWKARGNGYANTVTEQGWQLFRDRVQQARTVLEEASKLSTNCPEWYRAMQTVALAQGWPKPQEDLLARAALAQAPGYYYFAIAQANYLLPKWYGRPGETEAYARQVADAVGGREGDALYFQIAAHVDCCSRMQAPALDEARIQRGFAALEQRYGATNRERNEAAFLAVRFGDSTTAQSLFARIGEDWSEKVWKSKARFDASKTGQPVGDVNPVSVSGRVSLPVKP